MKTAGGEPQFDWSGLVALTVHPVKVAIVEALLWIDEPLSAVQFREILDREYSVSPISYHLRSLATYGVLTEVSRRQVRGAIQKLYFFPDPPDGSESQNSNGRAA